MPPEGHTSGGFFGSPLDSSDIDVYTLLFPVSKPELQGVDEGQFIVSVRKISIAALASTMLFCNHYPTAYACFCMFPRSIMEEFDSSAAVFQGIIVNHDRKDPNTKGRILFDVLQSWKGVKTDVLCVRNLVGSDCALENVVVAEQLLVYATGSFLELNHLIVHQCTRTGQLDGALQDVKFLDDLGYFPIELDAPSFGNFNGNTIINNYDFAEFVQCISGSCLFETCDHQNYLNPCCLIADSDDDGDVDLRDIAAFQLAYTGD